VNAKVANQPDLPQGMLCANAVLGSAADFLYGNLQIRVCVLRCDDKTK
jgi:hypothetical protein